jgi:hypothetical protein
VSRLDPTPRESLNPELAALKTRFETAKTDVAQILTVVTVEQAAWRPDVGAWSIGECIDHLCVVGRKLLPRIDGAISRAVAHGWLNDGPYRYGRLERWRASHLGAQKGVVRRRFKHPKLYRPSSEWPIDEVVRSFTHLQDDMASRLERANGIDLARVKITSPASRFLRLSLGQWFELIAGHQERHLAQARAIRKKLPTNLARS